MKLKARVNFFIPKIAMFSVVVVTLLLTTSTLSQLVSSSREKESEVTDAKTTLNLDRKGRSDPIIIHGGIVTNGKGNNEGHVSMDISSSCMYDPTDLKIIGEAIERALNFFDGNVNRLVLDAAVSTRSLEAQLKAILTQHPKLPDQVKQYLIHLAGRANSISSRIAQVVANNQRITFTEKRHTLPWVTTPGLWDWPHEGVWEPVTTMQSFEPSGGINASQILAQSRETIEENQSDACIFQVFNCASQETSDTCRKLFFIQEQSLYSLTHQVIYTLFAKKMQCFRAVNATELKKYQEKLCGKVWIEANAISQIGFPPHLADLFVEQVAICGMTGYPNFFRRDWLMQILRWQTPRKSGCFLDLRKPPESSPTSVALLMKLYHSNKSKFQDLMNRHYEGTKIAGLEHKVTSRQKRSDAYLRQGNQESCSVHFTAVGITSLAMHMRYFVDTCFPSF